MNKDFPRQGQTPWAPVTAEDHKAVMAELERLLASPHFRNSKRYPMFLRYVVTATLAGKGQQIKERTLGVEVFQRPADYDTSSDTVVRYTAGEVRKRLAAYYNEQGSSPMQIVLPVGSYIPEFFQNVSLVPATPVGAEKDTDGETLTPLQPAATMPPWIAQGSFRRRMAPALSLIILPLCILLSMIFFVPRLLHQTAIERFWAPLTTGSGKVFVYVGTDNAYMPSLAFTRRFKEAHHLSQDQREGTLIPLPLLSSSDTLTSADVYPKNNSLVDSGDLLGCFNAVSFLVQHHRTVDIRVGEELSGEDLADAPAVLIGAFSNKWTMHASRSLPFQFDLSTFDTGAIVEQGGQKRIWRAKVEMDAEVAVLEDYSIAARLVDSNLGKPLIIVAGLMAPGSRAASDFITSPELLEAFARNAPADWGQKNVEVVLRTEVLKGHPGPPVIEAVKYW